MWTHKTNSKSQSSVIRIESSKLRRNFQFSNSAIKAVQEHLFYLIVNLDLQLLYKATENIFWHTLKTSSPFSHKISTQFSIKSESFDSIKWKIILFDLKLPEHASTIISILFAFLISTVNMNSHKFRQLIQGMFPSNQECL